LFPLLLKSCFSVHQSLNQRTDQVPGFNVGGPIVLPGFDGHNRAFYFFNYEELRHPSAAQPPTGSS
jgi:hypothetical protein